MTDIEYRRDIDAARSPLRRQMDATIAQAAEWDITVTLKDLTVLAVQNDPFRMDTPAGHRDGAWLAVQAEELGLADRTIHLRGFHYLLISRPILKPDGQLYRNTDGDWTWLQEKAADAARWLGYIPFDRIVDKRNAEPTVRVFSRPQPMPYIRTGIDVTIPTGVDLRPEVYADDYNGVQHYKLVLVGEKSSLDDVLAPIAANYGADLYLPTGECSDTQLYRMARVGAEDGRPMVVFYFSDCDPAGWQMPVSVARKLQAFRTVLFPKLQFKVKRVALTPDQVRLYGLPSTPLKNGEARADPWIQATGGLAQTEIDALASLRPGLLRQIAEDAIAPFYDATLDQRVEIARTEWEERAQEVLDNATGESLAAVAAEAEYRLDELREQIDRLNNAMQIDASEFDLPPMVVPEAELLGTDAADADGTLLLDSRWPFAAQCRALIESKAYRDLGRPTGGEVGR